MEPTILEDKQNTKEGLDLLTLNNQIASLEKEASLFMQKMFEAQGACKILIHIRDNFRMEEKTK